MKLLFDLLPVILFFITYKFYGAITGRPDDQAIYGATVVIIVASVVQIAVFWLRNRRFERIHVITLIAVLIFGGLTLILRNPLFIKWKPTIVNWVLAVVFAGSALVGDRRPLVQRMMGKTFRMEDYLWRRLNVAWVIFFVISGVANIVVAYLASEPTWVNFKLFGLTGMSLVFVVAQGLVLRNHIEDPEDEGDAGGGPDRSPAPSSD